MNFQIAENIWVQKNLHFDPPLQEFKDMIEIIEFTTTGDTFYVDGCFKLEGKVKRCNVILLNRHQVMFVIDYQTKSKQEAQTCFYVYNYNQDIDFQIWHGLSFPSIWHFETPISLELAKTHLFRYRVHNEVDVCFFCFKHNKNVYLEKEIIFEAIGKVFAPNDELCGSNKIATQLFHSSRSVYQFRQWNREYQHLYDFGDFQRRYERSQYRTMVKIDDAMRANDKNHDETLEQIRKLKASVRACLKHRLYTWMLVLERAKYD